MNSELLDVAIGVVFVWFLYSVVVSAVNEAIAWTFRARSKQLWAGIAHLLDADAPVRRHLLVFGRDVRPRVRSARGTDLQRLYHLLRPGIAEIARRRRRTRVTHIAGDVFADAVLGLAKPVTGAELVKLAGVQQWTPRALSALEARVEDRNEPLTRDTVVGWAGEELPETKLAVLYDAATVHLTVDDVAAYVRGNPALAQSVRRAAEKVTGTTAVQNVKQTLETWFDAEMDRVSAVYRRESRKVLAACAVVLVLLTHANAVQLFDDLRHDASLRAVVANGDLVADACPPDMIDDGAERIDCVADAVHDLERYRIGLAWNDLRGAHERSTEDDGEPVLEWNDVSPYLERIVVDDWGWAGRLATAVAITFGAQLWFDALRRLVGLKKTLTRGGGGAAG